MHRTHEEILQELKTIRVAPGQRYQHYKTHGVYTVLDVVVLEATDQPAVVYASEDHPELKWVREYQDFIAVVDNNGHTEPRFRLLDA